MVISNKFSIKEEVWVRRDIDRRGKPYSIRESFAVFWILLLVFDFGIDPLIKIVLKVLFGGAIDWTGMADSMELYLVITLPLVVLTSPAWIFCIKRSAFCPVWFYGEQLNPERLRIFHLLRSPTSLPLRGLTLDPKTKFKHYTTLTITDQDTGTTATLGLLTPEEYDRFMQYWNAANARGLDD